MSIRPDLTPIFHTHDANVSFVRSRIHYKMRDYAEYRFTPPQSCAINIFFDLAQEFESPEQLHLLSVLVLRMFFQYNAELYLKNDKGDVYLATPRIGHDSDATPDLRPEIWNDDTRWYVPVRGRNCLVVTGKQKIITDQDMMGVLVFYSTKRFASHELLFLEKFANRVGFCLHNKALAQRNTRHILFLRKLAHDIGHNIITPNMRLQLLLNHLEKQLKEFGALCYGESADERFNAICDIHGKMEEQLQEVMGTFKNSALFMETLLRQSHFDFGHYVLRRNRLNICSTVITPQFERYRQTLEERSLHIPESQPELPPENCMVDADMGLISQALANLLSNAAKYTSPRFQDKPGQVRCKAEFVDVPEGSGNRHVKVSVFTSGPNIPPEEARRLFEDNFRAGNATGQSGTGHGLFFVREIIAEHGGTTGYEPARGGNVFYFTLPLAHEHDGIKTGQPPEKIAHKKTVPSGTSESIRT